MKRLFLFFPVVVCFAFFSCKKVHGPANGHSVQLNNDVDSTVTMSATIDGDVWQTDSAYGYTVKPSGNDSTVVNIQITATKYADKSSIELYIANYTGPNTYTINPPLITATYTIGNQRHYATSGKIVINAATTTAYALRGNFDFKVDKFFIDNGVFDVAHP